MEVAGCVGTVTAEFDSTVSYFAPYLTDKPGEFTLTPGAEARELEQRESVREALEEGIRPRRYAPANLERRAILRGFAEYALEKNVLLLHGSCVAVDGWGYLFTAPCGTGKSTHTRLWREVFGSRAVMVNDDKPFVSLRSDGVWVSGSPWCGKHGLGSNITVPLAGICVLSRGSENRIRPLPPEEALPLLLPQSYRPLRPESAPVAQALTQALSRRTPTWHMTCTISPTAPQIAWQAMHPNIE